MRKGVVSFVMAGCSACHNFVPRLVKLGAPYRARGLPIMLIDIDKSARGQALANQYKVSATPTTLVIGNGRIKMRRVGAVDDAVIAQMLDSAFRS